MEIIDELEAEPRGVYCGAIGRLAPDGDAAFNVAIRTLTLEDGRAARPSWGSAPGSSPTASPARNGGNVWRKETFVEGQRRFDLIETMAFDPREGILELDRHLAG